MLEYSHPAWTGILFRREVIEKVGLLTVHNVGLVTDLYFELFIAANFPIVISPRLGAIFLEHPLSAYRQASLYDEYTSWF